MSAEMPSKRAVPVWRILMGILYLAAGVNHFVNPDFYTKIMPLYLPAHLFLVQLSGVAELVLGAGVIFERTRRISAWGIIAMLVVFLLVHVDMLQHHADRYAEIPLWGLWVRLPVQGLLIYWAWRYARAESSASRP